MLLFVSEGKGHDPGPPHVELPPRIDWCLEALSRTSVNLDRREFDRADRDDLIRVHHPHYLDSLQELCDSGGGILPGPTFVGRRSLDEAAAAAGACVAAARAALQEEDVALALVRPPGHHAERAVGQGFCLINNAAVAAEGVRQLGAGRIAIVDIDVHHGNGTQAVFWEDENVLYLSLHQYPWYPWVSGSLDEVGAGGGVGKNVNVPLPARSGDETYGRVFTRLVEPIVTSFQPEFLIVSAGFDAHERDDISLMEVTAAGFGGMGSALRTLADHLCGGRLFVVLEGGYDREGLGSSIAEFVVGAAGDPKYATLNDDVTPDSAVESAAAFHLPRWSL